ncbi:MAG: UTP--glucose-1-phosphate uridylyltransferase [Oligoflexia bacterium]|nr:UTP--glucose-1-phosphate uridylyltransferase [Oligoflexia bacterium]
MRTAVLPVAGFGTRFLPITKAVPKELLPLLDRPLVDYAVAEAAAAGIERVVMVTSHGKDALPDYFAVNPDLERHLEERGKLDLLERMHALSDLVDVVTVRQRDTRGLGHAVLSARAAVGDEAFAVLLADDVIDAPRPVIAQLMDAFSPGRAVVALMDVPRPQTARYGVCAGQWLSPGRLDVQSMVEKPAPADAPSTLAIVGRYILPPEIFDLLEQTPPGAGNEYQLTDAMAALGSVTGVVYQGRRFDAGSLPGWLAANLYYARKRPDLAQALDELLKDL